MSIFTWGVQQLVAAGPEPKPERQNPHPSGVVIREGCAPAAVLAFLLAKCGMLLTHAQIVKGTGHSTKSVDWAIFFLRTQGLMECVRDAAHNSRYLRYRAAKCKRAVWDAEELMCQGADDSSFSHTCNHGPCSHWCLI